MEEEATHRAIMIANLTGAPLYVVHVSAKQAVEQLAAARAKGQNVFGETCPQYLYLSLGSSWARPASRAPSGCVPHRCAPGPRVTRTPCGRRSGPTTCRSSPPTCPFCMKEQKELGLNDFRAIPNGLAGSSTAWT